MPRGGGALGSIQGFSTRLSRFPGGGAASIQVEEWVERGDYMERKRTITLFDFQCQDSIFHEGLVGIMRGGGRGEYSDCVRLSLLLDILLLDNVHK